MPEEEVKATTPKVATVSVPVAAGTVAEPGSLASIEAATNKPADKSVKIAEGTARAKKAFEEGQVPGFRGHADDGVPSAEDNAAANDRIREAGLASVHDRQAIRDKHSVDSHERMAKVVATTDAARLGFNPNDHAVKYTGADAKYMAETGKLPVGVVAPKTAGATATETPAQKAERERAAAERERLAAEARARGEG